MIFLFPRYLSLQLTKRPHSCTRRGMKNCYLHLIVQQVKYKYFIYK